MQEHAEIGKTARQMHAAWQTEAAAHLRVDRSLPRPHAMCACAPCGCRVGCIGSAVLLCRHSPGIAMAFRHRLEMRCRVQSAAREARHAGLEEAALTPGSSYHCSLIESSGSAAASRSEDCGRNAAHHLCGDSDRKLGGMSRFMAEDCSLKELLHPWQALFPAQVCQPSFAATLSHPYFLFTRIESATTTSHDECHPVGTVAQ